MSKNNPCQTCGCSCKCLEIIDKRLEEINRNSTPMEAISEKDFFEVQVLLKIYKKIQDAKIKE